MWCCGQKSTHSACDGRLPSFLFCSIHLFLLTPRQTCLAVGFRIRSYLTAKWFFLCKIIFTSPHSLHFRIDFRISFSIVFNAFWDLDSVCIESIDQFEEHWHLDRLEMSMFLPNVQRLFSDSYIVLIVFLFAYYVFT